MALELIEIKDFPRTTSVTGSGDELIVVSKADGKTYGITTSDFKAFLGTVQSVAPRPIAPTDPAPTIDTVYIPTITQNEGGTPIVYTNAGGLSVNTAEGGEDYGMAVQFLKNDIDWVKSSYPLPQAINRIPEWMPASKEKESQVNYRGQLFEALAGASSTDSPFSSTIWDSLIRIEENITSSYDRPDLSLEGLTLINEDNFIIGGIGSSNPESSLEFYDRPDLEGFYFIDSSSLLVYKISSGGGMSSNSVRLLNTENVTYTDMGSAEEFNARDGDTYPEFIAKWDDLLTSQHINPSIPQWATKSQIGSSSTRDIPFYCYEFIPPKPIMKVVLTGVTHGWEKNPAYALLQFMSELSNNWMASPMLQWARWNVHFIVVPVRSPEGWEDRIRGVKETLSFPATWSKTGSAVTVTFDANDFPNTGGRLSAGSYFSHAGLAGKIFLTIEDSSNVTLLPNTTDTIKYRIASVVNGQSVTIPSTAAGDGSGTCNIHVRADPNRNWEIAGNGWENFSAESSEYDNKGTKPLSLAENIAMANLLSSQNDGTLSVLMDFHAGAGDYRTYDYTVNDNPNKFAVHIAENMISYFHEKTITTPEAVHTSMGRYASENYGMVGLVPEWGYEDQITEEYATEQLRWFSNLILIVSRIFTK